MPSLDVTIQTLKKEAEQELEKVTDLKLLEEIERKYLKKELKNLYAMLKDVEPEKKKALGKDINDFKTYLEDRLTQIKEGTNFGKSDVPKKFYDETLLKRSTQYGRLHPLTKFTRSIERVFINMGFHITYGPEIEIEENNFDHLNLPKHHPARDMQDTFYISMPELLLRSHTSTVQIRTMQNLKPPFKIISPGIVYRVDDIDPTHTPMFYQVEGLVVGENISFSDLKGTLIDFIRGVFGEFLDVRFRPCYYPYVEPGAAVDMECPMCRKKGCRTCGDTGWITVLGAGMVHPNVFEAVGYNSKEISGFAFGLGLNRFAMIYYGLPELRPFYENNVMLWEQL